MDQILDVAEFLETRNDRVVLDVRSPGEYDQGHIPGALSFPLFTDEERARVGTTYKQTGPDAALQLGLDIVGPKMGTFTAKALALAPAKKLAVHCWRGGQRSKSMAWLLRLSGCDVVTLQGGYKAYRRSLLDNFIHEKRIYRVVGGRTGSGKTKILHALRDLGEQIVDLEALAHHKGSAFGSIGELPQPTVEQFENELSDAIAALDPNKRIWLENESRSIGRVFLPDGFWEQMKAAPLYNVEIPQQERIDNLVADYARCDPSELVDAFRRIDKKLGGQHLKAALEAVEAGDYRLASEIALVYYDKTYQYALDNNLAPEIHHLKFETADPKVIAKALIAL